jgi:hypothetical protein
LDGQPMVGKTDILIRLSDILGNEYVPIMIDLQGLKLNNALRNLDDFAFELAELITRKYNKYARHNENSSTLGLPIQDDFRNGKGRRTFYKCWNKIRRRMDGKYPVIMIDEIEHLLDYSEELDSRIIVFLTNFLRNPDNGNFIVAGSEKIRYSENKAFYELVAKAQEFIRVRHYNEETVTLIFSATQRYFTCDDEALRYCAALCDGHPRFLKLVFKETVAYATQSSNRRRLEKIDIEMIIKNVIEQAGYILQMLEGRLSDNEREVVKLISQKEFDINQPLYSLHELVRFAGQQNPNLKDDYDRLVKGVHLLEDREWLEWQNEAQGLFRFKLGIFPMWFNRFKLYKAEYNA